MNENEEFFFGVVRAIVILGGLILAFSYGACEIAHRWEARAPERDHPEPCQDSAIEVDDTYKRQCSLGAIGTIDKIDGKAIWVCRCARDGGSP